MFRITRVVVTITALASSFGVLTSTATAITWHNTGSTSFTATAGSGTYQFGSSTLFCSGGIITGTATGGSTVGAVYSASGTATASPCTVAGNQMFVHCNYTVTATSQSGSVVSGTVDQTCFLRLTSNNVALCVLHGPATGTYTNPSGSTPGRVTVNTSNTLTVTHASGTSCSAGTGPASAPEKTGTISNGSPTTRGPILTRTS